MTSTFIQEFQGALLHTSTRNFTELRREAEGLQESLQSLRITNFLAEGGLARQQGFLSQVTHRLLSKVLPPPPRPNSLIDEVRAQLGHIGPLPNSETLAELGPEDRAALCQALEPLWQGRRGELEQAGREAIEIVSARLAAWGLDSELLRNCPALSRYENPFLAQSREVHLALRDLEAGMEPEQALAQIPVLLHQCQDALHQVHNQCRKTGTSLHLTRLLLTTQAHLKRLEDLVEILANRRSTFETIQFVANLIDCEQRQMSLFQLFEQQTSVLALRITEQTSHRGRHYIAETRSELRGLFVAAAGAGVIIATMAVIKTQIGALHLPTAQEAFLYSFNYGLGFVIIHLLGFTVATKQPAMTAATLAQSLCHNWTSRSIDFQGVVRECRKALVSQMTAIAGNVVIAFPFALLLGHLWFEAFGSHVVNIDKAHHLFDDHDPFHSLAIAHAGMAGIGLFLSGIVSGLVDNQTVFFDLPGRFRHSPLWQKLLGIRREIWAQTLERQAGPLAGNVFLGCWLGCLGSLGSVIGLPLDIRHVAFAAANLGLAVDRLGWPTIGHGMLMLLGVALIALTNLTVSFGLALWVALTSRGIDGLTALRLPGLVWRNRHTSEPIQS